MSSTSVIKEIRNQQIEEFISRLENLKNDRRGDLAILKRNAGNTIAESKGVYQTFYQILPRGIAGSYNEEIYYLIATLYSHNRYPAKGDLAKGDFGTTMRFVKDKTGSENIDHRMSFLLDSNFDRVGGHPGGGEVPYRLRQCIKLANGHEVGVNWPKLLFDLMRWDHPDKWVQKRWAESYFGYIKNTENGSNDQSKDRNEE